MKNSAAADLPLVSIIVPVYNVEKYLPRCLESIYMPTMYRDIDGFKPGQWAANKKAPNGFVFGIC